MKYQVLAHVDNEELQTFIVHAANPDGACFLAQERIFKKFGELACDQYRVIKVGPVYDADAGLAGAS